MNPLFKKDPIVAYRRHSKIRFTSNFEQYPLAEMKIGSIHRCSQPTIIFLTNHSIVELDFTVHTFDSPTALFLKKGQYFKFLEGTPEIFPLSQSIDLNHYRYLFSHLTGIGHVLFNKAANFVPDLEKSLDNWRSMNPFNATEKELGLLFDTNDFFENNLEPTLSVIEDLPSYRYLNEVSAKHIKHSLHQWKTHKLIVQAKYLLFFAGKSIQEVAYELRFKDPAYFGRFFRRVTHQTPGEFISINEDIPSKYVLLEGLKDLIEEHFRSHHFIQFYADRLNMAAKTLSEKTRKQYGLSVKELITNRLLKEARKLDDQGYKNSDISFMLGFKEVSHFSTFCKKQLQSATTKSAINKDIFVNN